MKVITLNNPTFLQKLNELFHKIDVTPDLIIEVLNAGGHLGDVIKSKERFNDSFFCRVKIQRSGESIKKNFIIRMFLKFLPYSILDKLRIFESNKAKKLINELNLDQLFKVEINLKDLKLPDEDRVKNILIIDDAIDTGRTMFLVKENFKKKYPHASIKIAVISWTIKNSIVKPDFYIFKNNLVRFPWSKDYKGKDFEEKSFSS